MHLAVYVLKIYRLKRWAHHGGQVLVINEMVSILFNEFQNASNNRRRRIFSRHGQHAFATNRGRNVGLAQNCVQVLLDKIRLSFFDDKYSSLSAAKTLYLLIDQRIRDVQNIKRDFRIAEGIGQSQELQSSDGRVIHATLQDDSEILRVVREKLVQAMLLNVSLCRRPAFLYFFEFVQETTRRQNDPARIARGIFNGILQGELGSYIVFRNKAPVNMTCTNAQFQHHWRIARFRESE